MFPFTCWFYVRFYYNKLPQTSGGFEIASTIIVLLRRKRQASWASHVRVWKERNIWIIWMPYTWFNSIKFFFPWWNHLFLYKKMPPSSFSFWLFKRIDYSYWFLFPEAIFQATYFNSIRVHYLKTVDWLYYCYYSLYYIIWLNKAIWRSASSKAERCFVTQDIILKNIVRYTN